MQAKWEEIIDTNFFNRDWPLTSFLQEVWDEFKALARDDEQVDKLFRAMGERGLS